MAGDFNSFFDSELDAQVGNIALIILFNKCGKARISHAFVPYLPHVLTCLTCLQFFYLLLCLHFFRVLRAFIFLRALIALILLRPFRAFTFLKNEEQPIINRSKLE